MSAPTEVLLHGRRGLYWTDDGYTVERDEAHPGLSAWIVAGPGLEPTTVIALREARRRIAGARKSTDLLAALEDSLTRARRTEVLPDDAPPVVVWASDDRLPVHGSRHWPICPDCGRRIAADDFERRLSPIVGCCRCPVPRPRPSVIDTPGAVC